MMTSVSIVNAKGQYARPIREWTSRRITPAQFQEKNRVPEHSSQTLFIWTPFSLEKCHQSLVFIWHLTSANGAITVLESSCVQVFLTSSFIPLDFNKSRSDQCTCPRRHKNKIQKRVKCKRLPDCHIKASHMNSLTASRPTLRHIEMRPANLLSEYGNREITTTWYYVNSRRDVDWYSTLINSRRNVDSEKFKSQMGFEPTTLRDLVGCSTTELLGTLWWARFKLWVLTGTASRGYTATCWLPWTH